MSTGIQHVVVEPDKDSAPPHCHSLEEEIFVILDGDGVVVLGAEETPVGPGHVISRPAGTGVAHVFRVTYEAVDRELPDLLARVKPDALLMFGLAGRTRRLGYRSCTTPVTASGATKRTRTTR